MPDDEKRLRESFDELRRIEASGTPPFRRVWSAAQNRLVTRSPRRRLSLGLAILALTIGSLLVVKGWRRPAPASDVIVATPLAAMHWKSPTDFLLDTPGSALGRSLPGFASVPNYSLITTQKEN